MFLLSVGASEDAMIARGCDFLLYPLSKIRSRKRMLCKFHGLYSAVNELYDCHYKIRARNFVTLRA